MKGTKVYMIIIVTGVFIFSCGKEYLDKQPIGNVGEEALANKKGVEGMLIGAYSLLDGIGGSRSGFFSAASNWVFGSVCGSEAYTGSDPGDGAREIAVPLEKFSPTTTNEALADKWATLYDGIQRANDVLRIMAKAKDISEKDGKRIAAEARFLRAHYHFEAKKIWNKIPFVNDSISYANGNYRVGNQKDVWPDIENDLLFAMNNLEDPNPATPGRANKYIATALLAKAYLFQKKFNETKPLLEKIINSGRYSLRPNYHDNFNPETKNNEESIFSVQMSVNDGSQGLNGNYGDLLNFPMGGPGGCCGFFSPSQYLVNHFKTNLVTGLPEDNFNNNDVTSDEGIESSDPFTPYAGTLDPRLDWTVGRRGVPYLDWGNHPGKVWTRSQGGPFSPKKNVYSRSQQAHFSDVSFWSTGATANNLNLIRYADVLLWAAEVEVEIGSLEKAKDYVNKIRGRMIDPTSWVKKADGSPAANYKIDLYTAPWTDKEFARKAVRYERMLEFGMEGHRFFDLVRWGIADTEINAYLQREKNLRTYLISAVFTKNKNEYFPIPQTQIDLSAGADGVKKMIQNPNY
jgi:hypothetical protein